jgi:hypothetical protein
MRKYSTKDTVLISVNSIPTSPSGCFLDLSKVQCKNTDTNHKIVPIILNAGINYMLIYVPTEKGRYIMDGDVENVPFPGETFAYPGPTLKIHNEFSVK